MAEQRFDVIVVGSGAAGLYATLCLPASLRIALVTKDKLKTGASDWAQGGIAAAGGEEALQEASSQVLQNLIEKGVYNPEEAAFGGVGEAAAMGGGAGAVIGAVMELALGRRLRGAAEPAPAEEPRPAEPLALPAPRIAGYEIDSQGNVVRAITEAQAEAAEAEGRC